MNNSYQKVIEKLSSAERIIIGSHSNPDGDTIGSSLALSHFLKKMGKEVVIYNESGVPFNLKFLPDSETIITNVPEKEFDVLVLIDVGDLERVSEDFKKVRFKNSIVIDHHVTVTGFGDVKIIDHNAAATGVLIYKLLKQWNEKLIDREIAIDLYTAIMTDTGSFKFSNTNSEAFLLAAELVEKGAVPYKISMEVYENFPFEKIRLLSTVLSTITMDPKGRWAYIVVTRDILTRTGATPDMLEDIINYVRGIRNVKVAIQFREIEDGKFKVGFRSKGIDVEKIAKKFGGGGHKNASGCKMEGTYKEIISKVIKEVEKNLR